MMGYDDATHLHAIASRLVHLGADYGAGSPQHYARAIRALEGTANLEGYEKRDQLLKCFVERVDVARGPHCSDVLRALAKLGEGWGDAAGVIWRRLLAVRRTLSSADCANAL